MLILKCSSSALLGVRTALLFSTILLHRSNEVTTDDFNLCIHRVRGIFNHADAFKRAPIDESGKNVIRKRWERAQLLPECKWKGILFSSEERGSAAFLMPGVAVSCSTIKSLICSIVKTCKLCHRQGSVKKWPSCTEMLPSRAGQAESAISCEGIFMRERSVKEREDKKVGMAEHKVVPHPSRRKPRCFRETRA